MIKKHSIINSRGGREIDGECVDRRGTAPLGTMTPGYECERTVKQQQWLSHKHDSDVECRERVLITEYTALAGRTFTLWHLQQSLTFRANTIGYKRFTSLLLFVTKGT